MKNIFGLLPATGPISSASELNPGLSTVLCVAMPSNKHSKINCLKVFIFYVFRYLLFYPQYICPRVNKANTRTVKTIIPTPAQITQDSIG
jgi:hypothetical protein